MNNIYAGKQDSARILTWKKQFSTEKLRSFFRIPISMGDLRGLMRASRNVRYLKKYLQNLDVWCQKETYKAGRPSAFPAVFSCGAPIPRLQATRDGNTAFAAAKAKQKHLVGQTIFAEIPPYQPWNLPEQRGVEIQQCENLTQE